VVIPLKKIASILISSALIASTFALTSPATAAPIQTILGSDCDPSPVYETSVQLGSAAHYQILAGAALTWGADIHGALPAPTIEYPDAVADLSHAIAEVGERPGTVGTADLGGLTYSPGVHLSPAGAAFAVTGDITLDGTNSCGQEDPDSVFIFYTPAALNTTAGITVPLMGGAKAKNIYWVAGAAITLGAGGTFYGTFMSNAAITTGASEIISGNLLAAAAVTVAASNHFCPGDGTDELCPKVKSEFTKTK